jgi:hypothetical protein
VCSLSKYGALFVNKRKGVSRGYCRQNWRDSTFLKLVHFSIGDNLFVALFLVRPTFGSADCIIINRLLHFESTSNTSGMALKRSEINKLVMDYLVAEGFKEAAEKFKVEAGVEIARLNSEAGAETGEQLDQRIEIRSAIEEGNISKALWLINQNYPELIDQNRQLFFKLHVTISAIPFIQ